MNKFFSEENKAILLTDYVERKYFSEIDVAEGFVLLTPKNRYYFSDARYFLALKEKLSKSDIIPVLFNGLSDIKKVIESENISSLGIDFDKTTVTEYNEYKKIFGISFYDCSDEIKELRAIKSESETENIKKASEIAEKSFYETLSFVKKGMTERELCDILERRMNENGGEGTSFETIVAFNENSAVPHHETGDKILTENSVILIDFGCKVNGYMTDCTRTFFFGEPDGEFVKNYNAVWGANELCEKLIFDGINTDDADKIARDYFKSFDLDGYFTHSLGHGVGLEIHEFPTLSPKRKNTLKNGMVFTVEPGVYFDGKYGIRIEDTVILKNGKTERFFTDSKDLLKIKIK